MNTPPLIPVPTAHAFQGNGTVGQMHVEIFSALPNWDIRPTFLWTKTNLLELAERKHINVFD